MHEVLNDRDVVGASLNHDWPINFHVSARWVLFP